MKRTKAGYSRKIEALGLTCTCWDCLRASGITPPMIMRDRHPRLHPRTIFAVDFGGVPSGARKGTDGDEPDLRTLDADERRALRAAVRNREAI